MRNVVVRDVQTAKNGGWMKSFRFDFRNPVETQIQLIEFDQVAENLGFYHLNAVAAQINGAEVVCPAE